MKLRRNREWCEVEALLANDVRLADPCQASELPRHLIRFGILADLFVSRIMSVIHLADSHEVNSQ
jgi:hypothetical protein